MGKINGVMAHDLDYELSIWGASTASVNFNPQIIIDSLGVSAMNMGIIGTNIDQYYGLLKEYLSYTENSKTLIIALDMHGGLDVRSAFYDMYNWLHHIDRKNIYECFSDMDNARVNKLRFVPFYKLTNFDKHAFPYFRRTLVSNDPEYKITGYGFQPKRTGSFASAESDTPFETVVDQRSSNKIRDAISMADSKGIQCYLVITPCFVEGLNLIENKAEFISKLKTFETSNTKLLDFSNCYISQDSTYFTDNTHLNPHGADELTRLLIREISQN